MGKENYEALIKMRMGIGWYYTNRTKFFSGPRELIESLITGRGHQAADVMPVP